MPSLKVRTGQGQSITVGFNAENIRTTFVRRSRQSSATSRLEMNREAGVGATPIPMINIFTTRRRHRVLRVQIKLIGLTTGGTYRLQSGSTPVGTPVTLPAGQDTFDAPMDWYQYMQRWGSGSGLYTRQYILRVSGQTLREAIVTVWFDISGEWEA